MSNRRYVLIFTLIATLLSVWLGRDDDVGVRVIDAVTWTSHRQVAAVDAASGPLATAEALVVREDWREPTAPIDNAFRTVSFLPPPPPPVIVRAVEPPRPVAPTFPFRFFGRVNNGTDETIYLARDDRLVPITTPKIIDEAYRIDAITATEVRITYLPLNEQTILTLPSGR